MKNRLMIAVLALVSMLPLTRTMAEDIDLFVGRSGGGDAPNVLLVLDNTGNWGPEDKFVKQQNALIDVLESLEGRNVRIGLMMYTETGGDDSGPDGGYVRAAIRDINTNGYLDKLTTLIGGLDEVVDRSNSGKSGKTMAEAYLYFLGGTDSWEQPYSGRGKAKTDYEGNDYVNSNATCCDESHDVWDIDDEANFNGNALVDSAGSDPLAAKFATQYNSPVDPNSCGDNYIIYIGNGPAQDSNADHNEARSILQNMDNVGPYYSASYVAGAGDPNFELNPPNSEDNLADEWAYYMNHDAPVRVSTFAIDIQVVNNDKQCENNAPLGWSRLMENMSKEHGGGLYARQCGTNFDETDFKDILAGAFNTILARDSVFASVALPAAANEQSTFLNQVYVGMFRPDAEGRPRWYGNLKQYQIGLFGNELMMADANGTPLVETAGPNAGFVKGCARSFWTPTSESSPYYWDYLKTIDTNPNNDPVENCDDEPDSGNAPDGNIVEKGGQAYVLRATTPSSRKAKTFTCNPALSDCNSQGLELFEDGNPDITGALLDPNNPVGSAERVELINWAIGYDVDDEDQDSNTTEMRPSAHGDIVHAQPVAVDYAGDPNNPDVVVFYGGNDGMLRAINGTQDETDSSAGSEYWAFMPPEFFGGIKRLRENDNEIRFPATGPTAGTGVAGDLKDYGMDGALSAYEFDFDDNGTVDSRVLLANMRRAARMIYSFDISSKTAPLLNWKIGCSDPNSPAGCTAYDTAADADTDSDWEALGQTWSRLVVTYAEGYDPNNDTVMDPIIIMGGGYDPCEDDDDGVSVNHSCDDTNHTKIGNRIYILDAATGNVLNWLPTDRSVPGTVTVVPVADDDPRIMYAYAADTGGNVYRIHGGTAAAPAPIATTPPASWKITPIASLGCDDMTSCDANRKFLFGPDVVRIPNSDNLGILLGSGDREKPLTDYSVTFGVENYFYSLVDDPDSAAWLDDSANAGYNCANNDLLCHDALTTVETGDDFDPDVVISEKGWKLQLRDGEQVVTGSITLDNTVNFSTHIAAQPESCDAEYGEATAYKVNYQTGDGFTTQFLGGGLVPTPVAGKVLIDGKPYPFCIGCGDEGSPLGAGKAGGGITWTQYRSRVFWNIDQVE